MSAARAPDALVVGGGVIGCAVAYFLARERASVVLLERDDLHAHASGAAAGMLAPISEAGEDGPLLRFGLESLDALGPLGEELRDRCGVDVEYVASGVLRVACDDAEARALRARAARLAARGLELGWLDAAEARSAVPGLADGVRGGVFSPREAHLHSARLTEAYARAAAQLGARIETGSPVSGLAVERGRVTGVRTPGGTRAAGCVILCTGAWTRACAAWLPRGCELPIEPVRGQIVALDAPHPAFQPIVWGPGAYLVPKRDARVVVGATVERVGFDARVTAAGVRDLLDAGLRLLPSLAPAAFREAWAGLRPKTPDDLPAIGPLPGVDGLLVAAGHYRNGVLLSPLTGRLVAGVFLGKGLPADAAPLRAERFL